MAKVLITIEDIKKDGKDGLRISVNSDPEFPADTENNTIAQKWSLGVVNLIMENASEVSEIDNTKVDFDKLN